MVGDFQPRDKTVKAGGKPDGLVIGLEPAAFLDPGRKRRFLGFLKQARMLGKGHGHPCAAAR